VVSNATRFLLQPSQLFWLLLGRATNKTRVTA
jgi:hypothetical protein